MASHNVESVWPILTTPMNIPLQPSDQLFAILSSPPFVEIPGTFNARDLSAHPSQNTAIARTIAFRAGSLENLNPAGREAIKDLGIKTIFDLRSLKERYEFPTHDIDGVEIIWTPSTLDNETTLENQANKQTKERDGPFSLVTMYMDMMETHSAAIAVVLKHIAAHPGEPFLFHCTAGRDRTGMLAFLLEDLAGSDVESMNLDFALTRVGIEPEREFLMKKLLNGKELPQEEIEKIMGSEKMKAYSETP